MIAPRPSPRPNQRYYAPLLCGLIALCVLLFLGWLTFLRIERINYVSATPSWSADAPREDAHSLTGYSAQQRRLIIPGHHNPSYRWIAQTQRALAGGSLREHHVGDENFPTGYQSNDTLPYRAWLTFVAWIDHASSPRSAGVSAEHGALYADPLLHGLLIISVGIFAGIHFGGLTAAAAMLALGTLFPFAGGFQPGAPDHHSLAWTCGLWSALFFLTGILREKKSLWFTLAGIAGGIGIWTDRTVGEPVLLGLTLGAGASLLLSRNIPSENKAPLLPWRIWGLSGALTCLFAYSVEYFPGRSDWTVDSVHPLHVATWLGIGELLYRIGLQKQQGWKRPNLRTLFFLALAVVGVTALPASLMLQQDSRFLAEDPFASELVNLVNGIHAPDLGTWIARDGMTSVLFAVGVPLVFVGLALYLLFSKKMPRAHQAALLVVLGPVLVSTGLAVQQLRWWNGFDATTAVLIVAIGAIVEQSASLSRRWFWRAAWVLASVPGALLLLPPKGAHASDPLDGTELQSVVERDLAYWLAQQHGSEPAVVFTTPGLAETLNFYGNTKGIASYDPKNRGGLSAAVRMASASTWAEVSALFESRGITHVILPSWDSSLNRLVQLGRQLPPDAGIPRNTLVAHLQAWELPPWLRLMTYHTPTDLGADRLTATVLAVRPEQDEILAACRMSDYLVEMGLYDAARSLREKLQLYPRSLPALTALAQANLALGDTAGFKAAFDSLLPYVSRRAARTLPVDRRISLAALLVQSKQMDEARTQMTQCNQDINADRLRELTTSEIVRLLAMNDVLGLAMPDPQLRPLALSLLPPTLRSRLTRTAN